MIPCHFGLGAILSIFGIRLFTPDVLFEVICSDRYYCCFDFPCLRVGSMPCKRSFADSVSFLTCRYISWISSFIIRWILVIELTLVYARAWVSSMQCVPIKKVLTKATHGKSTGSIHFLSSPPPFTTILSFPWNHLNIGTVTKNPTILHHQPTVKIS